MKKLLLLLFLFPVLANAQLFPTGIDSTTFTFSNNNSLIHHISSSPIPGSSIDSSLVTIDTSSVVLWQIGNTLKSVFSNDTIMSRGMMTDTLNVYPSNANDFFVLKLGYIPNFIVEFWHKYQTDSGHAGGIVEFSTDSGATWMNVANCAFVETENFYSDTDTLVSGFPSFTGNSHGEQLSGFMIQNCSEAKTTTTICSEFISDNGAFYFRFRFVSDSTIDSLSGWMIDSIRVINAGCSGGYVPLVNRQNIISIFPNPACNDLTVTGTDLINRITITNLLGQVAYTGQYNAREANIDVSYLPVGIYFIKVNGSEVRKFLKE